MSRIERTGLHDVSLDEMSRRGPTEKAPPSHDFDACVGDQPLQCEWTARRQVGPAKKGYCQFGQSTLRQFPVRPEGRIDKAGAWSWTKGPRACTSRLAGELRIEPC